LKTTYVTDGSSSLGGLGSVAYRDPEYFREVQNQVWAASPTRFIDLQRPSDVFESLIASESELLRGVLEVLEDEYDEDSEFTDYIDIVQGADWKEKILKKFFPSLTSVLDSESSYTTPLSGYFGKALSSALPGFNFSDDFISKIIKWFETSQNFAVGPALGGAMIANNPQTKISTPPIDSKIALDNSIDLGLDYRGVEFVKGYSTLQDYWGNIPYPGMESLYNPIAADSVGNLNLRSIEAINYANLFTSGSILGEVPDFQRQDQDIYAISLIGETINGYTTFDPATMSNGDAIDISLIPNYESQNADPDGGRAGLSRTFTPAF
jgi:hypothetical protein